MRGRLESAGGRGFSVKVDGGCGYAGLRGYGLGVYRDSVVLVKRKR